MMKLNGKIKFSVFSLIVFCVFFINIIAVGAQIIRTDQLNEQDDAFIQNAGYSGATITDIVGIVIKAFLSLLGVIFIILIVLAGYNWMTAYGEESKVDKAKNTLRTAIIGLIITVGAYAITNFVLNRLL